MTPEQTRDKIRKLEAVTEARGATPAEAATARDMAMKLRLQLPRERQHEFDARMRSSAGAFNDMMRRQARREESWRSFEEALRQHMDAQRAHTASPAAARVGDLLDALGGWRP